MFLQVCVTACLVFHAIATSNHPLSISDPTSSHTAVYMNGSATLQCSVSDPSASITWYTGSPFERASLSPVQTDDQHFQETPHGSLTITGYRNRHHGGSYFCKAESGTVSGGAIFSCPRTVSLAKISAEFEEEPSDSNVTVGSLTVLKCTPPISDPPATITWWKDSTLYTIVPSISILNKGYLYLLNVTEEDSGHYQCVATNPVTGRVRHSRKASLNVIDYDLQVPQSLIVAPRNMTVQLNGVVDFQCLDNFDSAIKWEWVGHASLPMLSYVDVNGALVLFAVSKEMNGAVFRCTLGDISADAHLTVTAPPDPMLVGGVTSGFPGDTVSLFCMNRAHKLNGEVNVIWQVGGVEWKWGQTSNGASKFSYTLPDSVSEIWIQCMMMTQYGDCNDQTTVVKIEKPDVVEPPPPVTLTITSNSSVMAVPNDATLYLNCSAQVDEEDLTFFNLYWSEENEHPFIDISGEKYWKSIAVSHPGSYVCKAVALYQSVNLYRFSDNVTVTKMAPKPSVATVSPTTTAVSPTAVSPTPTPLPIVLPPTHRPSNVTLIWLSSSSLLVSWTRPHTSMNQSDILGYKLNWGVAYQPLPTVALRAVSPKMTNYTIHGLNRNRGEYSIRVWSYSIGGDGPSYLVNTAQAIDLTDSTTIPTISRPTDEQPSPSADLIDVGLCVGITQTMASIQVNFNIDTLFNLVDYGGLAINYTCESYLGSTRSLIQHHSQNLYFIRDLQPGCQYNVTIIVLDSVGEPNPRFTTDSCSFTTLEPEAPSPVNFTISWVNPSDISISWSIPLGLPGDVTIEMNVNNKWMLISNGISNSFTTDGLNPYMDNLVPFRVSVDGLVIYSNNIFVPAQPRPPSSSSVLISPTPSFTNSHRSSSSFLPINTAWVTYGIGLGAVILSILLTLSLVLVLKHVQAKRRQKQNTKDLKSDYRSQRLSSILSHKDDSVEFIKTKPAARFVLNHDQSIECHR